MQGIERKSKRPRTYDKLPVIICEWHQHVLPHIHRAIASRHLPDTGLKMIHFDSHPDLTFPINLPASTCFERDILYEHIEIADWILPLVFENHVDKVVWMKPPWANQIANGEWYVNVGENKENQFLRISCKEDYFLEELLYEKDENLSQSKKLDLVVRTISTDKNDESQIQPGLLEKQPANGKSDGASNLITCSRNSKLEEPSSESLILDIDLDFFSTYNPFILRNSKAHFDDLAKIYEFASPKSKSEDHITELLRKRHRQLIILQKTIKYFVQNNKKGEFDTIFLNLIADDNHEVKISEIDLNYLTLLEKIEIHEEQEGRRIDLELVHFAGMSSELPHHRSTEDEITNLISNVKLFLSTQTRPTLVTISRSAEDEYTPPDQVEFIQEKVTLMLEQLYNDITITKDYDLDTQVKDTSRVEDVSK